MTVDADTIEALIDCEVTVTELDAEVNDDVIDDANAANDDVTLADRFRTDCAIWFVLTTNDCDVAVILFDAEVNDEVTDDANELNDAVTDAERFSNPWALAATDDENTELIPKISAPPEPPSDCDRGFCVCKTRSFESSVDEASVTN